MAGQTVAPACSYKGSTVDDDFVQVDTWTAHGLNEMRSDWCGEPFPELTYGV